MNLPKEINVLGSKWKIIVVDKPSDVDVFKRQALWGQCDYWRREIRVYKRQPEAMMQTFLHEVIHVILGSLGENDFNKNEKLVDQMAHIIFDTLDRNKLLRK